MATLTTSTRLFNFVTNTCIKRILPTLTYKKYYPGLLIFYIKIRYIYLFTSNFKLYNLTFIS